MDPSDKEEVCYSASQIKGSAQQYLDERQSLLGDSFSVYPFIIPAAAMCRRYIPRMKYEHLTQRMGMPPGFCAPIGLVAAVARKLQYGKQDQLPQHPVADLNKYLLTKVNHTGSDVRMTTVEVMTPKSVPRQSIQASWRLWLPVFSTKWKHQGHINSFELRAILLAARYQIINKRASHVPVFHLTDRYVGMSLVAKGRTGSLKLGRVLRD